jgi:hypothetical protein
MGRVVITARQRESAIATLCRTGIGLKASQQKFLRETQDTTFVGLLERLAADIREPRNRRSVLAEITRAWEARCPP